MINLLPNSDQKNIDREYRVRRTAVVFVFCFILSILAGLFLMPSYVISLYKVKGADIAALPIANSDSDVERQGLRQQIDDIKLLTRVLEPETYTVPSNIMSILLKAKTADNSLTKIVYTNTSTSTVTIVVQGVSKNRQALATFTNALGSEKGIDKVDVPVSNFAKDANIPFSFTITARNK